MVKKFLFMYDLSAINRFYDPAFCTCDGIVYEMVLVDNKLNLLFDNTPLVNSNEIHISQRTWLDEIPDLYNSITISVSTYESCCDYQKYETLINIKNALEFVSVLSELDNGRIFIDLKSFDSIEFMGLIEYIVYLVDKNHPNTEYYIWGQANPLLDNYHFVKYIMSCSYIEEWVIV